MHPNLCLCRLGFSLFIGGWSERREWRRVLPVLPCQPAPALTWRGHCRAWEGSSGSTPLENFGIFAESNKKEASAAGDISDVYFYPWETITINFILHFAYVIEQLPSGDCFSHYCLGLSPFLQFNISLLIPQLKHSARLCLQVFMPGVKRRGEFLSVSNLFCLFRVLRHNLSAFPFGSNFKPHKWNIYHLNMLESSDPYVY